MRQTQQCGNQWSGHRVMTERGNESEEGSLKAAAVL
jgi:hypothetical protein